MWPSFEFYSSTSQEQQRTKPTILTLTGDWQTKILVPADLSVNPWPWSYINFSRGHFAWSRYWAITLFFIRLEIRIRLKQPGEHKTQPRTCSADFPNQCPTAYSNLWNITMGPFPAGWIWLQQAATSSFEHNRSRTNSKSIGLNFTSPSKAKIKLFSFSIGSPFRLILVSVQSYYRKMARRTS